MQSLNKTKATLNISENADTLASAVAARFEELAKQCVADRGKFVVALSGGSTPRLLYQTLAKQSKKDAVPWESCYFFFGDERCVSHSDPESNYLMAKEALFDRLEISQKNIFATRGQERDALLAADSYQSTIREFFELPDGKFPVFDLILLGLGPDGHTASLFPGTQGLKETQRLVIANYVEKMQSYRITFTLPLINRARNVFFLVSGGEKAEMIERIFNSKECLYPAQMIDPHSTDQSEGIVHNLEWFLDKPATQLIK